MRILEVVLKSGNKATLFLSSNFVVTETEFENTCRIIDGIHNNGGWEVYGDYQEIVEKLKIQLPQ